MSASSAATALAITRKGGKKAVIPLGPRTARAIDLAIGGRCQGPIFQAAAGDPLDRHGAGRLVRRVARRAGLARPAGPRALRHASITVLTPASRSATCKKPPRTPTRAHHAV
jgi:integrase/recombinase XerC